jgi:tetratricopeptide (TPR) repeat protein
MSNGKRISRNDPCPCGSKKKYKKCCLGKAGTSGAIPGNEAPNRRGSTGQSTAVGQRNPYASGVDPTTGTTPLAPAEQLYEQAMMLRSSGRSQEAKEIYENILRSWPQEVRAMSGLGYCLIRLGQRERGLEEARRAVESDPGGPVSIMELALMLLNLGEIEESIKWARRAVKLGPQGAMANTILANCYERTHRIKEGLEANKLAQKADPQNPWLKLQEAKLLARNGDLEQASRILRKTASGPGIPPELQAQAFGELGRVLDKLQRYDQAYNAFVQSGLLASRTPKAQSLKLEHRPSIINSYVQGLTEERLKKWKPEDFKDNSWAPVFLVGFPRSGTTMTEQVLAAHSQIMTLSEVPYLDNIRLEWARIVGAKPDLGLMVDQLNVDIIMHLRKSYREKAEADQEIPTGSKIVIDKVPLNIINIGLINLIFPEAKIIVALRDPRDCGLSCFMQDFELNSAMIHFLSLDRAVRFYTQVMGAWLHFRNMITMPYIEVRYEDTVRDLEFQAKRLMDFLSLDWEPDVLQFHRAAAEKAIITPSYVAVTEPVHTRAIGRWKNYQGPFAPLLPVLEPFVREFGYDVES